MAGLPPIDREAPCCQRPELAQLERTSVLLKRTRHLWKRRAQRKLFKLAGMQGMLDEQLQHSLEDSMGFRGQWDEHRRYQLEELKRLGLTPSSTLLEIGCGPLTAGIPLIEFLASDGYVGVDVRSSVLDMSWQQIGRAGLSAKNPRLICSDSFGSAELGDRQFDFIWAFSVLFHLSDELLDKLFANFSQRLAPRGPFIANIPTNADASTWLEFPFLKRSVEVYETAAAKHGLRTVNLGTIAERGFKLESVERDNILLQFSGA